MFFRPSAVLYAFQPISLSGPLVLMLLSFHICLRLSIRFSNFYVFNQIRIPHLFISPIFRLSPPLCPPVSYFKVDSLYTMLLKYC